MTVAFLSVEYAVGTETGEPALQSFRAAFERAGDELRDFGRHTFPRLVPVFEDAVRRQFDARGKGPAAGQWKPLSPSYEKWKARAFPGMPLMERTGDLREALTDASSSMAWREWSASEFSFGTAGVPYASYHQTGTGRLPARPVFDFGSDFDSELTSALQLGIVDAMRAARVDEVAEVTP